MKKWIWFLMFLMIGLLFIACGSGLDEGQKINWNALIEQAGKILLVVIGVYEILARVFPSVRDWTLLGNIMKFLIKVSDWLNNYKKEKYV